ncbi:protoporphyrinogen oxidase [Parabacteroides acidifaciens]|uniref:Coproporphyrinogen III oxidase n=1 Tax=Parabacteroides acidifaciens TaxID=2290935 RepID=A0A3D8HE34_9BACT|nr:protoporphyrinogen oxidase [Parabacteroides acidifaciens]MBC8602108.1 protoporphyrinogen oxidase [Parabacteroides acidifaciens]RDU49208.1 protoporphyrinogen oxidase [Parabacteroides acidifaciens]
MDTDIVIIGAGLTGLTTGFWLSRAGKDLQILECSDRVGGQIHTFREEGFVFESGPNTGVVSYPEVAELFAALAPACTLETAREESKRRLIWKGDRFHALPSGLFSAVTTPLFTLGDKFRILGEPFRAKGTNPDESVGELAARRLGKSFLRYAVDPFLSGVYAGDPLKLVTRYALPKLYNLEQEYGSFIRGSIAKARQPKTKRDLLASKKVFSAVGGLDRLTTAMADAIGHTRITLSAADVTIRPSAGKWQITYTTAEGLQTLIANKVITTTGAYTLPSLLPFIPKEKMEQVSNLHYAPVVQASVGFRNTGGLRFEAFGGLVPSCEKKDVLGILFPAACFAGRAPEGGALFSFFIGGVKHANLTTWPEDELEVLIRHELHAMLKFPEEAGPDMIRIFRHEHAIPQYEQNSGIRFATIAELEASYPGLILAGNLKGGIGMADRIRQATEIANHLTNK